MDPDTAGYLGVAADPEFCTQPGLPFYGWFVNVLVAAPPAVSITFPASRYIDTAGILLPALPLFAAIRLGMAFAASPTERQGASLT